MDVATIASSTHTEGFSYVSIETTQVCLARCESVNFHNDGHICPLVESGTSFYDLCVCVCDIEGSCVELSSGYC